MSKITEYKEEAHEFGMEDLPNPPAGIMYVFYEEDKPVSVDFMCPCGCGNNCYTPLLRGDETTEMWKNRRWGFKRGPNGPTIIPSIKYVAGCKSHFNITDGKVIMHADSGK